MHTADTERLRSTLGDAARRLVRNHRGSADQETMLTAIVAGVLAALPAAVAASVSLIDRKGVITTHAPSSALVAEVDRVQARLRDGPCIDALDEQNPDVTLAPDLSSDPPWREFAGAALDAGFHGVLSFRLIADGSAGALNIYSRGSHEFSGSDQLIGALFADQAAVALAGARRTGELQEALGSRDVIGRAKGILMERFGASDEEAFTMLVESSQNTNMKLNAVADWLVRDTENRHAADRSGRAAPGN